nr:MAG TPA: hypothetical protein [Caudoviricetes sp.]
MDTRLFFFASSRSRPSLLLYSSIAPASMTRFFAYPLRMVDTLFCYHDHRRRRSL